jgi:hypothetical protein
MPDNEVDLDFFPSTAGIALKVQKGATQTQNHCVHNCDSTDFMKKDKFLRYILRKTKHLNLMSGTCWMRWEILWWSI